MWLRIPALWTSPRTEAGGQHILLYIYIYTYVYIHTYIYIYTHIYMYTHTYIYIYSIFSYVFPRTLRDLGSGACGFGFPVASNLGYLDHPKARNLVMGLGAEAFCLHLYIYIHTYIYIYIYIHTYIYIYIICMQVM